LGCTKPLDKSAGRCPETGFYPIIRQFPNRRLQGNNLNSATFAKRDFAVQHRQAPGADKVKLLSLYHRFVIASHSPDGVVETGLRVCPPEKKRMKACERSKAGHFLRCCFRTEVEELRRFSAIFRARRLDFSALQTVWRSERNSNSRYSFLNQQEPIRAGAASTIVPLL
jgi:hypothetical protein